VIALSLIVIIVAIAGLPLFAGTSSYPLTVVEGNSMYPTLQEGDLVYYQAVNRNVIPNGTIIIFTQNQSGNPLNAMLPPIVIHRVVNQKIMPDGSVGYVTKGDNNNFDDGTTVQPDQILGAYSAVIPKVGIAFLFIKSAQGLIACIGLIVVIFMMSYENKWDKEKKKQVFLSNLAQKTLNQEFPEDLFKKFEMVVRYGDDIAANSLNDPEALVIEEWVKKGAIYHEWKIENIDCGSCGGGAIRLVNRKGRPLQLCKHCLEYRGDNGISADN